VSELKKAAPGIIGTAFGCFDSHPLNSGQRAQRRFFSAAVGLDD
jgi:hypothetical protein